MEVLVQDLAGIWDMPAPGRPAGPAEVRALAMAGNFFHTAHPHTLTDIRLTLLTQIDIFWEKRRKEGGKRTRS